MSVVSVQPKDFILALFIRDDGERFLLGDNGYDFTDSQLHFSANTIENDEVEKQGADGTMLAGQVRRASVQTFDGYVGDATTPKEEIEQMRRAFIAFFLKGHHYRVVYVDCARNAWQRKGGYLVDAPEVKELFQVHPEYHVGLNFEDVNYYSYDENADGDEITANLVQVAISSAVEGGLVWDEDGAVSEDATVEYIAETADASGENITINNATSAPLKSLEIQGNTSQQTYTGKNQFDINQYTNAVIRGGGSAVSVAKTDDTTLKLTNLVSQANNFVMVPLPTATRLLNGNATISFNAKLTNVTNAKVAFYWLSNSGYTDQLGDFVQVGSNGSYSVTTAIPASIPSGSTRLSVALYSAGSAQPVNSTVEFTNIQVEAGSTATTWEKYVGGVPAPNPDYPQAVQTVTGENVVKISDGQGNEQSYEVNLGKNLFDKDNASEVINAFIDYGATAHKIYTNSSCRLAYIRCEPNTTYTISKTLSARFVIATTSEVPANNVSVSQDIAKNTDTTYTITTNSTAKYLCVFLYHSSYDTLTPEQILATLQIEKGSQATSYAAYFAPIELCKIGDYQDYIYKSGDKWYLREEVGSYTFDGSEAWGRSGSTTSTVFVAVTGTQLGDYIQIKMMEGPQSLFDSFTFNIQQAGAGGRFNLYNGTAYYTSLAISFDIADIPDITAAKAWLASNTPTLYGVLATPTDTEITNAALIAQLEAILKGGTSAGTNNIALIPSGNEQGSLEITYYTKYIVNIIAGGYEWEQGGSGGPTIVMNESIDNVYPIWTITGPITNPVLENTTTGEQIEYVGTIGEGQTLIIDMGEQTALLDGLNVLSNVAGEFISLAPGANTLLYSASVGDTASEIGWSEIVG